MDEILWVVDEKDTPVCGESRTFVHSSKLWHRGVHAFMWDESRELLVQRRTKTKDKFPGHWDCSLSEHVCYGESYEKALFRGLKEELGMERSMLRKVHEMIHFRMRYGKNDYMICKLYFVEIKEKAKSMITLDDAEVEEIKWVCEKDLADMLKNEKITPWFREMLKYVLCEKHSLIVL